MDESMKNKLDENAKTNKVDLLSSSPKPMTEKPSNGEKYWTFAIMDGSCKLISYIWENDDIDNTYFGFGIFHSEEEARTVGQAALQFIKDFMRANHEKET